MGKFGWSLPPGCSFNDLPGNQPVSPCECCGRDVEAANGCICPECPECGATGDPNCYSNHGLRYTVRQIVSRDNMRELMRLDVLNEQRFWDQYKEEREQYPHWV